MKNKLSFAFIMTSIIFAAAAVIGFSAYAYNKPSVLFISSYSYDWDGLEEELGGVRGVIGDDCEIKYKFMNTKNIDETLSENLLYSEMQSERESGAKYDAVILADDAALNFGVKYHDAFFSGIPVVFLGVNDVDAAENAHRTCGYTGVIEKLTIAETVNAARRIYPEAKRVVAISDNSITGQGSTQQFLSDMEQFPELEAEVFNCSERSLDSISNEISEYDYDTILIYLMFSSDIMDNYYTVRSGSSILFSSAGIPIFKADDLDIENGFLGGSLMSYSEMGSAAAEFIKDALNGGDISAEPPVYTVGKTVFNSEVMNKFGISENQLPEGAEIINENKSFFELHRKTLTILFIIALLVLAALVYFIFENFKIHRLNRKLTERENILDSLINTTVFKFVNGKMEMMYYSRGVPEMTGRTDREFEEWSKGDYPLEETVHPADIPRFLSEFEKIISGKSDTVDFIYRLRRKDGEYRWTNFYITKAYEENGVPVYAGLYSGISQEAKMYRKVIDDSPTGLFVVDNNTKNVIYVNNAMHNMRLSGSDEILGRKCSEAIYGCEECCDFCPIDSLTYNSFVTYEYLDEKTQKHYTHRARLIDWNGIPAHIVYVINDSETFFANREIELSRKTLSEAIRHSGMGYWEYYPELNRGVWSSDYTKVSSDIPYLDNYPDSWFELGITAPGSVPVLREFYAKAKDGEKEGICEVESIVDGESVWERLHFTTINDKSDGLVRVMITAFDITKEMQLRLKFQDELTRRSAMEASYLASAVYNVNASTVVEGSISGKEINEKCTIKEFFDKAYGNKILDESRETLENEFSKENLTENYANEKRSYSVPFLIDRDDGRVRCYSADIRMTKNPAGDDIYAFIYIMDITSEWIEDTAFKTVVEKETDYISYLDTQTGIRRLLRYNENAGALPKKEELYEESIERSILELVPEDEQEFCRKEYDLENIKRVLEKNDEHTIIHSLYSDREHTDKRRVKMRIYYLPKMKVTLAFERSDITDIYNQEQIKNKQLQEALREAELANAAKSDFMSRMSHEIRTPMNAVLGMAAIGSSDIKDKKAVEYFEKISSSGTYLLGLINDILDMSKLESQKVNLSPAPIEIKKLTEDVDTIIKQLYVSKNITMVTDFSGIPHKYAYMDSMRVQQILINLLGNAIKFSDKNSKIEFGGSILSENGKEMLVFTVRDYGVGMSEEFVKKAFIPFEQELNAQSAIQGQAGTGLGLAISKNLAELMGGRITVESRLGEGSKFMVYIPYVAPKVAPDSDKEKGGAEKVDKLNGKTMLLAEDHPLNTEIATRILSARGVTVDHAADGNEAVKMFAESEENKYDLILMDIMMPNLNGLEAAKRIRALDRADAKTVPIAAMSANAYEDDVRTALNAGINGHIAKPLNVKNMFKTIEDLL